MLRYTHCITGGSWGGLLQLQIGVCVRERVGRREWVGVCVRVYEGGCVRGGMGVCISRMVASSV